jgi:hypothetical protein
MRIYVLGNGRDMTRRIIVDRLMHGTRLDPKDSDNHMICDTRFGHGTESKIFWSPLRGERVTQSNTSEP